MEYIKNYGRRPTPVLPFMQCFAAEFRYPPGSFNVLP